MSRRPNVKSQQSSTFPRHRFRILLLIAAAFGGASPAAAAVITVSSNYADITSFVQITGGTGSVTVSSAGVPPSSLNFQTVRNPTSVDTKVRGYEECGSCLINPSLHGNITAVTFAIDVAVTSFQNTTAQVGFEWLVYQNGNIYRGNSFAFQTPSIVSPTTTYSGTVVAADFHQVIAAVGLPDGSAPSFTAGSAPINFGFAISNGASPFSGIPAVINGTIPNFVVTATTESVDIPEPSSFLMMASVLSLLGILRASANGVAKKPKGGKPTV